MPGQPGPDGTITYSDNSGTYTQRPGEIAVYTAKTIDSYSAQPTQGSGQASGTPGAPGNPGSNGAYSPVGSATSPNGANGNNGANGANNPNRANGTDPASNKPKKDPNDPNVQKLWDYLKHADHKAVRDLVSSNFDMFYASLPEQKALMMKILIDGRTTGEDQACMAQIADMSRQQGESDAMIKELNRLFGGDPKGVQRMLEDCKQGARDQILQALFGDPPQGVTYDPGFYNSLISVMTKKDVEHLCQTLGLSPGAPWLARIPSQLQAALANKLNSFWSWLPFNKSKSFKSALINAIQSSPNSASQSPSGQRSSGAQPSAGQQAGQQAGQNAGAKTPAQAGGGNNQAPQQQQQPAGPSNPWDLQDGKRDYPVLAARYHLFNTSANVDAFCNEMKGYETNGALGPGSTNTQSIQALQGALARLGYQVQATGSYDQQTIAAVVAFKQAAGLHQSYVGQDGRPAVNEWADPTTLNAIQQRAGGQAAAR